MSPAQAILAGAALIAASIIFVTIIHPANAAVPVIWPFQLMHHSNTAANAGVFRLNVSTGEVSYCYLGAQGQLACSASVQ